MASISSKPKTSQSHFLKSQHLTIPTFRLMHWNIVRICLVQLQLAKIGTIKIRLETHHRDSFPSQNIVTRSSQMVQWTVPRPCQYIASEVTVTSISNKNANTETDIISDVFSADLTDDFNTNQDSNGMNTCTASNIQKIHHLTKVLCDIDDFEEVFFYQLNFFICLI